MTATDLAKVIYECDIHALTDYYSFIEVEYEDDSNNIMTVFGYDSQKHVPQGMYLWLSSLDDAHEGFVEILKRVLGEEYVTHIFFTNGRDLILKIEN